MEHRNVARDQGTTICNDGEGEGRKEGGGKINKTLVMY